MAIAVPGGASPTIARGQQAASAVNKVMGGGVAAPPILKKKKPLDGEEG